MVNAALGLHISARPLPFCSCFWAQQEMCGNKSRISPTREEQNLRQQLTGKQNICLLSSSSPHLKSYLTSEGESDPFASVLEDGRAPHQPGAGSALSGGSFSFICATLPSTLMAPVINSTLYSSLTLFHSHFVEVVSLPWQKASHFARASVDCCFRLRARTAAARRNVPSTIYTLLPGRVRSVPIIQKCEEPIRGTGLTQAGAGTWGSTAP